ncbi:MAG: nitrite reductase small subunit NirD [Gammaproteobacteria bacterium]|nr:nitrite reductase small subunit NirD [Gammaproteobacteria bacterium]
MSTSSQRWAKICAFEDIPVRGAVRVQHGSVPIAIFRTIKDEIRALEDKCPHKGGPLSDGIVHSNCVTCPLHNWDISLDTGQAMGADSGSTNTYNVKIEDGQVLLEIDCASKLSVA